jgi:uncharacterized protein YfeS
MDTNSICHLKGTFLLTFSPVPKKSLDILSRCKMMIEKTKKVQRWTEYIPELFNDDREDTDNLFKMIKISNEDIPKKSQRVKDFRAKKETIKIHWNILRKIK